MPWDTSPGLHRLKDVLDNVPRAFEKAQVQPQLRSVLEGLGQPGIDALRDAHSKNTIFDELDPILSSPDPQTVARSRTGDVAQALGGMPNDKIDDFSDLWKKQIVGCRGKVGDI